MTTLVARIKILPADLAVNLDSLLSKVKGNIPNGIWNL
jgi:translation elongation factor EF-1beta